MIAKLVSQIKGRSESAAFSSFQDLCSAIIEDWEGGLDTEADLGLFRLVLFSACLMTTAETEHDEAPLTLHTGLTPRHLSRKSKAPAWYVVKVPVDNGQVHTQGFMFKPNIGRKCHGLGRGIMFVIFRAAAGSGTNCYRAKRAHSCCWFPL